MPSTKKRAYDSASRKIQAQETKERILLAAQKLFQAAGFQDVTIEQIALEAKVSMPTVYALYRSKVGVLKALLDQAIPAHHYEELVRKTVQETSPVKHLAMSAAIARQMYDAEHAQLGLLQSASILDTELKELELQREERRYVRQEKSFRAIIKPTMLAAGIDMTKARDILWAFTGRDLYRMLVAQKGWSPDEYEFWLAQLLVKTLLK